MIIVLVAACQPHWPLRLKLGAVLTVVVITSFSWSVVSSPVSIAAYVSTSTRAWELAAGALLALGEPWLKRIPDSLGCLMTWIGLTGIVIGALTLHTNVDWPGSAAAWPVTATALVIAGGNNAPRLGAHILLRLAPFQWLGLWSYSLYLWHKPIDVWAVHLDGHPSLLMKCVVVGVAIGCSGCQLLPL